MRQSRTEDFRGISSKVERSLDMREVVGALPTSPTINFILYNQICRHYKKLPGNYCEGATPDPIPNSEVKSFSANGTLS